MRTSALVRVDDLGTVRIVGRAAPGSNPSLSERRAVRLVALRAASETLVTYEPNTGCHLWLGEYFPSNYGRIGSFRDPWGGYAHRAVLWFAGIELERGGAKHVRHSCDQPACVNPAHLTYSPALLNRIDRVRRGPRFVGPDLARTIYDALQRGERPVDLARQHGIHKSMVSRIGTGSSYAWATGAREVAQ